MDKDKKNQLRGDQLGRERGVYKIRSFGRASLKLTRMLWVKLGFLYKEGLIFSIYF